MKTSEKIIASLSERIDQLERDQYIDKGKKADLIRENKRIMVFAQTLFLSELHAAPDFTTAVAEFDVRGVRPFVKMSSSGTYAIECYRKKTAQELDGLHGSNKAKRDADWQMIRVGHIQTYETRQQANAEVLKMATEICTQFEFEF